MYKRTCIMTTFLFLAPVGLAACGSQLQSGGASAQVTPTLQMATEVTLTDTNNGQTVNLQSGQTLVISLKGNITTGYNWEVSESLPVLQEQGSPDFKPDSGAIGAPGVFTLRFKVTGSGSGKLTLVYHRPSDTTAPPAQTYSVQVVAH